MVGLSTAKCDKKEIGAEGKRVIKEALSSKSLGDIGHAVAALAADASLAKAIGAEALKQVNANLMALVVAKSGLARGSPKDSEASASALNAGRLWLAVAKLAGIAGAPKIAWSDEISGSVDKVLAQAVRSNGVLSFSDPSSELAATSAVVLGLEALARQFSKPSLLSDSMLSELAAYFIQHKSAASVHTAFHVVSALAALSSDSPFRVPLVLSVAPGVGTSLDAATQEEMLLTVSDVLGKPVEASGVIVSRFAAEGAKEGAKPLAKDKALKAAAGKQGEYRFDALSLKPALGFYELVASVQLSGKQLGKFIAVESARFTVKITGGATLGEIYAATSDTGNIRDAVKTVTATFPAKAKETLKVTAFQHLHLGFFVKAAGKTFSPQQAFARFVGKEQQITVQVPSAADGKFALSMALDKVAGTFAHAAGVYTVTLFVGDALLSKSITYELGKVDLGFNPTDNTDEDPEESAFAIRKTIVHTFKTPEKRPPAIVALVFAGLVSAPILLLFTLLRIQGANTRLFPASGSGFINAMAFQGCIVAILALFIVYWIGMNIFNTLFLLGPLGLCAAFSGKRALGDIKN